MVYHHTRFVPSESFHSQESAVITSAIATTYYELSWIDFDMDWSDV